MTIKGLLQYALLESDEKEFQESVMSLAKSDKYDEIYPANYAHNDDDYGFPPELQRLRAVGTLSSYKIKKDFPFLSHYDILQNVLPENFVSTLLKNIALELKKHTLDMFSHDYLKRLVTGRFYDEIKLLIGRRKGENDDSINEYDKPSDIEENALLPYLSELGRYIEHVNRERSVLLENTKRYSIHQRRYYKLQIELLGILKNIKNDKGIIIPIYSRIQNAGIPRNDIEYILKSIEKKYGNRFIITDSCFIAKSKARVLITSLKGNPSPEDACLSLVQNGVPRQCITSNFLYGLGFGIGYKDSEYKIPTVVELKKVINRRTASSYHQLITKK